MAVETLQKEWTAPIYAFFKVDPIIEYVNGRRCHTFICGATHCKNKTRGVRRYLDTSDATSTGNLRKHARKCWTDEVVQAADKATNAEAIRESTSRGNLNPQSITACLERQGKGTVTYSHRQHTKTETRSVFTNPYFFYFYFVSDVYSRAEIVKWVAQSMRPFNIVKDEGFLTLMKTGRPGYAVPSPSTVARDVKVVFAKTRNRIAKMLRVCSNILSYIQHLVIC